MTEVPSSYAADLARVWTRLSHETYDELQHYDAVYLPGLSEGMVESCKLFDLAANQSSDYVAFNGDGFKGPQPTTGWPGAQFYIAELQKRGVEESRLVPTEKAIHTRSEMDMLVRLARERGWKRIGILTVLYHFPRVLSSAVGSMESERYQPRLHFIVPPFVNWHQSMVGSQGTKENSSFLEEAGDDAVLRLFKYWERGAEDNGTAWKRQFGAPAPEMLRYLDWRDTSE